MENCIVDIDRNATYKIQDFRSHCLLSWHFRHLYCLFEEGGIHIDCTNISFLQSLKSVTCIADKFICHAEEFSYIYFTTTFFFTLITQYIHTILRGKQKMGIGQPQLKLKPYLWNLMCNTFTDDEWTGWYLIYMGKKHISIQEYWYFVFLLIKESHQGTNYENIMIAIKSLHMTSCVKSKRTDWFVTNKLLKNRPWVTSYWHLTGI